MKDVWISFGVDNALNKYYRPYAVPGTSTSGDGSSQNDTLWVSAGPGIVYKGAVRMRFSAM
jgi:hemoglobin/transferrin/lactoferrin receptor protein